jgi:predicted phage terminase large subunit-like protein
MYQQKPVPDEGSIFKKTNFRMEPHVAPWYRWHVYAAWDLAIGLKQQSDWTVGLIAALDWNGNLHIINRVRVRTDDPAQLMFDTMKPYKDHIQLCGIEQGQIQQAVMPNLERLLRSKEPGKEGYSLAFTDDLRPINDKVARSRPAQGWTQQGRIILPADQTWTEEFIAELIRFPSGVHDDQVDALSWLVRMVAGLQPPQRPKEKKKKSWKHKLKRHMVAQSRRNHMAA